MKALVINGRICDVVTDDKTFEVHESLQWIDCPDDTTIDHKYEDGQFVYVHVEQPYNANRSMNYPTIQQQLDTLYHEGYDGWKATITEIKERYPKP